MDSLFIEIMDDGIENNTKKRFTLKKTERLSSKKLIEKLFAEGESFLQYPLKIVFLPTDIKSGSHVQVGFTASKKIFKRAVDRNKIKRLLRESYRLNKHIIPDNCPDTQLVIFIIFIGKELPKYRQINQAMCDGLKKLTNRLKT